MEKQNNIFSVDSPSKTKEKLPPSHESSEKIKSAKGSSTKHVFSIFVDGAARGNPGDAGAGIFVALDGQDILKKGFFLGIKTNNQAEYLALALALLLLHDFIAKNNINPSLISFFSDSELLVKQMNHTYKVKNPILKQLQAFITTQLKHTHYTFTHVMREKNKIADKLANQGIDKKNTPPAAYQTILSQHGLLF